MSDTQKHTKPNVPNLRFPGFEGEWESKKLSAYLYENKERNRTGVFSKTDVLSVSGDCGIVNQIELLGRSFAGKSVANYHVVRSGDIVYTKSPLKEYPYGIVKYNNGKDGIVSTLYAVYHHKENVDGQFVEYYFTNPQRANKYFKPIVRIGAKHDMKIGNEEVLDNFVVFPVLYEQRRISEILSLLDKRIEIQNKVIEDLKSINRTIINRVFGSIIAATIPLYEVASRITERNVDSKVKNVLTISARDGLVSQLDFFNKTVASSDLSKYFLLKRGDFAYNKSYSSDYPWGAIKHLDFYDVGVLSPLYFCFRPNKSIVDTTYLQFYFSTDIWHKHIAEIAVEGARNHGLLNMSISDFMQMPVPVPDMTEQLAISQALKIMSDKLNVEEEYAKAINQQKQYLLGQLFL